MTCLHDAKAPVAKAKFDALRVSPRPATGRQLFPGLWLLRDRVISQVTGPYSNNSPTAKNRRATSINSPRRTTKCPGGSTPEFRPVPADPPAGAARSRPPVWPWSRSDRAAAQGELEPAGAPAAKGDGVRRSSAGCRRLRAHPRRSLAGQPRGSISTVIAAAMTEAAVDPANYSWTAKARNESDQDQPSDSANRPVANWQRAQRD